jgi:hypothetical protein
MISRPKSVSQKPSLILVAASVNRQNERNRAARASRFFRSQDLLVRFGIGLDEWADKTARAPNRPQTVTALEPSDRRPCAATCRRFMYLYMNILYLGTMTKEATLSIRLTTLEKGKLEADARLKGIPAGAAVALERRFPILDLKSTHETDWGIIYPWTEVSAGTPRQRSPENAPENELAFRRHTVVFVHNESGTRAILPSSCQP